jgi:hypothetical protein
MPPYSGSKSTSIKHAEFCDNTIIVFLGHKASETGICLRPQVKRCALNKKQAHLSYPYS